jgi:L,D-peptidoglycan transpeptidase YkuD (ErfK/YbiS/YcfS/YnhG family)
MLSRLLRSVGTASVGVAALVLAASLAQASFAAEPPPYFPTQLSHVGDSRQVIVVTSPSWTAPRGTLRAYEKADGHWRLVVSATPADLGWSGMAGASARLQDTGKTPAGTFRIPYAFGRLANPGTGLPYRQFDRDDAWTYSPTRPSTYNVLQTAPVSWTSYGDDVEILWRHGAQYRYAAVLDYNLPSGISRGADGIRRAAHPADTRKGGGIFLHVSDGSATAGCIAVPEPTMRRLLDWLDPAQHPVLVAGPIGAIGHM